MEISHGKIRVRQNDYEVYVKGELEMGGLVNLIERVEYIGKEIVYNGGEV